MEITQDTVLLKQVPAVALVCIVQGKTKTKGITRWVNLAVMKSICHMEEAQQIHLYPVEGAVIKVQEPESVKELLSAIASYTITPL